MLPILFPVACVLAGCIAAMFTRSKLYAIVLPGSVFAVVSIIRLFALSQPGEIGEGILLASPFMVAGFFLGLMYSGLGALITWRVRGKPGAVVSKSMAGAVPSPAVRRYLSNPISVDQYCAERGWDRSQLQELINEGAVKAYIDGAGLWIEDRDPRFQGDLSS